MSNEAAKFAEPIETFKGTGKKDSKGREIGFIVASTTTGPTSTLGSKQLVGLAHASSQILALVSDPRCSTAQRKPAAGHGKRRTNVFSS